jgi:membrane-associated phospholipid phosphatase
MAPSFPRPAGLASARALPALLPAALGAIAIVALSPPSAASSMPGPLHAIGPDAERAFGGWQFLYLGAAVAETAAMAPTGGDHAVRVAVQTHLRAPAWGDGAYYAGYILPALLPLGLYVEGLLAEDRGAAGAGSAALQALAMTELATLALKVGTGRPYPTHGGDPASPDRLSHPEYAYEFDPFGFAGRYAWPSGHTSAAVSVAAALTAYTDGSIAVAAVSYPIAFGIGFGMIVGDRHWTSDVLAGALLGQGIGWSVGDSFRHRTREGPAGARLRLLPLLGATTQGCALVGEL